MTTQKKKFVSVLFMFFFISFAHSNSGQFKNVSDKKILKSLQQNYLHGQDYSYSSRKTVQLFKKRYTTEEGKKYLSKIMKRSALYRKFIETQLRTENVPYELLFLPVIESGFYTKAVSRSGAVGIWQFMRNSIVGYDININYWMDERRDPWKTTSAALKKLKWNYEYYGDWYLALAAYNCGVGALNNAIKKAGKADYWYLSENGYLKKETALYVPKFIAIAEILIQSENLGIDWGEHEELDHTEVIDVERSIDLNLLAEESGVESSVLTNLNPALKFNITPPRTKYKLRVPSDKANGIRSLLAQKPLLIRYYRYKVKSGDTLYALSSRYRVPVESILKNNPGIKPSSLKIGAELIIPAPRNAARHTGKKETSSREFAGIYTIKKGDTLWSVANAYNVQVEILAEKNNIRVGEVLSLGKILKVPIL